MALGMNRRKEAGLNACSLGGVVLAVRQHDLLDLPKHLERVLQLLLIDRLRQAANKDGAHLHTQPHTCFCQLPRYHASVSHSRAHTLLYCLKACQFNCCQ